MTEYFNARMWSAIGLNRQQIIYLDGLTTKLNGVEEGATADQTNAEIEAAYNAQVDVVTQVLAEAGVSTTVYRWTPQRVAQAIAALAGGVNSGVTTVDFGAIPGSTDTSVSVTGQTNILAGSTVMASITPLATADHSVDEHRVEEIDICAGNISPGTGFTIYAKTRNRCLYGTWSVSWTWR